MRGFIGTRCACGRTGNAATGAIKGTFMSSVWSLGPSTVPVGRETCHCHELRQLNNLRMNLNPYTPTLAGTFTADARYLEGDALSDFPVIATFTAGPDQHPPGLLLHTGTALLNPFSSVLVSFDEPVRLPGGSGTIAGFTKLGISCPSRPSRWGSRGPRRCIPGSLTWGWMSLPWRVRRWCWLWAL